ncbi:beat protein [Nesidiocoris tenuis]|uniref:Beat protein n=1 Tax=Nesidiocoris tenuis TaxID=355587 RepID=A0ABN7AP97_9HEMI|nr:beat protein [Nesidiocoris tenuis]
MGIELKCGEDSILHTLVDAVQEFGFQNNFQKSLHPMQNLSNLCSDARRLSLLERNLRIRGVYGRSWSHAQCGQKKRGGTATGSVLSEAAASAFSLRQRRFLANRIIFISCIVEGSLGLHLTELEVPKHADIGSSVTLGCFFETGEKNLYSVKWYKDDYEFYRFMPDNNPNSHVFPVTGVQLNKLTSDKNRVHLEKVTYQSTGTYKCEVSTEAPAFETVFRSQNLTVVAYPDRPPVITGHQPTYAVGDFITVNCTSGRANPEPKLAWYINGMKADSYLLDASSPRVAQASPSRPSAGILYSKSLGMRTRAEKSHFQGKEAVMSLKCTSTVGDLPPDVIEVTPRLLTANSAHGIAQEYGSSQGALARASLILILLVHLRLGIST